MVRGFGGRRVDTIKDVAQLAHVSIATVSRYMNGKDGTMAPEKRARIEAAIRQLDYRPNHLARSLRNASSRTLGIVFADILNAYSVGVLRGVEEACTRQGYSLIVCNSNNSVERERTCLRTLQSKRVDGVFLNTTGQNQPYISEFSASVPTVLVDRKVPGVPLDVVTSNNLEATTIAIRHLREAGCGEIVMLMHRPDGISPRVERIDAFQSYCTALGMDWSNSLHILEEYDEEMVAGLLLDHVRATPPGSAPPGILLGNGIMSLTAFRAARLAGLRIGKDFLMLGYDDPEWTGITDPTLSVISQRLSRIGEVATSLLLNRVSGSSTSSGTVTEELSVDLIARESSKPSL